MQFKVLRPLIAFFIVLLVGEGLSRMLLQSPSSQIFDPELGFTYRPHAEVFWGYEGFATNRLNSLGLNSPELSPRNRPWRVLIVGDSYSEGRHVPIEKHFLSVAMHIEPRLEVINAGREGLNVANFPRMQIRLADIVKPDLTVVILSSGRLADLDDNKVQTQRSPSGEIESITYKIEEQEKLKRILAPVLERSALVSALTYRFKEPIKNMLRDLVDMPSHLVRQSTFSTNAENPKPAPVETQQTLDLASEKLKFVLRQMQNNGPVAVLYMPQLDYSPRQQARIAPFSAKREITMQHIAQQLNIPFVSGASDFLSVYQETRQPLLGFPNAQILVGHLNPRGHQALGRALARLAATVMPSTPESSH